MGRTLKLAPALAICAAVAIGPVWAAPRDGKVALCHGTASASNPYVLIHVDESALVGHFDDTAPGHGMRNHPDFVLAAGETDCGDGEEEITE